LPLSEDHAEATTGCVACNTYRPAPHRGVAEGRAEPRVVLIIGNSFYEVGPAQESRQRRRGRGPVAAHAPLQCAL